MNSNCSENGKGWHFASWNFLVSVAYIVEGIHCDTVKNLTFVSP